MVASVTSNPSNTMGAITFGTTTSNQGGNVFSAGGGSTSAALSEGLISLTSNPLLLFGLAGLAVVAGLVYFKYGRK